MKILCDYTCKEFNEEEETITHLLSLPSDGNQTSNDAGMAHFGRSRGYRGVDIENIKTFITGWKYINETAMTIQSLRPPTGAELCCTYPNNLS